MSKTNNTTPEVPWRDPGYTNPAYNLNEKELEKSQEQIADTTGTAKTETTDEYNKVHETPNDSLNKNQNVNYAKTGGQYGHINNRSYAKTLQLAREADAYNNMPVAHHTHYGSAYGSGIQDMGVPYEKPQIQTMETRAMDQAFQLDTQRKMAEQDLQAAVARKDLDAFIAAYQQKYNIVLTKEQASLEMIKYLRQEQITDYFQKNMYGFHKLFDRYFSADTAAVIDGLIRRGDGTFAAMFAKLLLGFAPRNTFDYLEDEIRKAKMDKWFGSRGGRGYWTSNPNDPEVIRKWEEYTNEAVLDDFKQNAPGKMEKALKRMK